MRGWSVGPGSKGGGDLARFYLYQQTPTTTAAYIQSHQITLAHTSSINKPVQPKSSSGIYR
jgi:hypothetical protein